MLWLNADEPDIAALFDSPSATRFEAVCGGYKTVIIDEAQRIENIGIKLKLIADQLKNIQLLKLLQALSFQVENQVSFNELGQLVGLENETVEKYILLLEQTYIIFRLGSLQRNLRNELKRARKIYFYDNGIRNALISNFAPPELRQDTGVLWENFLMSERLKFNHYNGMWVNTYFWRTSAQQEIDYIEEFDGKFYAYEFKWNPSRKVTFSKSFIQAYQPEFCKVISQNNYDDFLLKG